ncbi:hypothetical protein AA0117_g13208 [Alternaria alternata]|uniref:Uncharacterized protein n=1 Tax=Alternaria alternata TaxID=5599 RepID=A0A4Q4MSH7_ALTAL|nr:hypothetical protein AA0117_g13208 [Alternaria alternata]
MPEPVQAATQRIRIVVNDAMLKGNGYGSEIVPDDSVSAVNDYQDRQFMNSTNSATNFFHKALRSAPDQSSGQAPSHPLGTVPALLATAATLAENVVQVAPKTNRYQ